MRLVNDIRGIFTALASLLAPVNYLTKREARTQLRSKRDSLAGTYRDEASRAIVQTLVDLPEITAAGEVHCYWPLLGSSEVDTREIIASLRRRSVRIFLPVVVSSHRRSDSDRILEAEYVRHSDLKQNQWGILQPEATSARRFDCDVAIVPGFGVSISGVRIGHGWGYYDELLRGTTAPIIMPCFDACLVSAIAAEAHDRTVSCIVTETTVIRPGATL